MTFRRKDNLWIGHRQDISHKKFHTHWAFHRYFIDKTCFGNYIY